MHTFLKQFFFVLSCAVIGTTQPMGAARQAARLLRCPTTAVLAGTAALYGAQELHDRKPKTPRDEFDKKHDNETTSEWYIRNLNGFADANLQRIEVITGVKFKYSSGRRTLTHFIVGTDKATAQTPFVQDLNEIVFNATRNMNKGGRVILDVNNSFAHCALFGITATPTDPLTQSRNHLACTVHEPTIVIPVTPFHLKHRAFFGRIIEGIVLHEIGHHSPDNRSGQVSKIISDDLIKKIAFHEPDNADNATQIQKNVRHLDEFHADFYAVDNNPKEYTQAKINALYWDAPFTTAITSKLFQGCLLGGALAVALGLKRFGINASRLTALTGMVGSIGLTINQTWHQEGDSHPSHAQRARFIRQFAQDLKEESERRFR